MFNNLDKEMQKELIAIGSQLITPKIESQLATLVSKHVDQVLLDPRNIWLDLVTEICMNVIDPALELSENMVTNIQESIEFFLALVTDTIAEGDPIPVWDVSDIIHLTMSNGDWWHSRLQENLMYTPNHLSSLENPKGCSTSLFTMAVAVVYSCVKD